MKRFWPIILSLLLWGAIVWYIFWSSELGQRRRSQVVASELSITIADSMRIGLLDPATVEEWISEAGLDPVGMKISEISPRDLTDCIMAHNSVRNTRVYVDLEGVVHVTLTQREPIMRVVTADGYDFYITEDRYVLPAKGYPPQYIPVITGLFGLPFDNSFDGSLEYMAEEGQKKSDKNYIFLGKLINFVEYTGKSDFWRSQIVQVNVSGPVKNGAGGASGVSGEPEVEFIPRVGDHVVLLGRLDGFERKLDNLMIFYRQAVPVEGWNKWKHINLKYDGQVVCR